MQSYYNKNLLHILMIVTLPCVWAIWHPKTTLGHRIGNKLSRANSHLMRAPATSPNSLYLFWQHYTVTSQGVAQKRLGAAATVAKYRTPTLPLAMGANQPIHNIDEIRITT